MKVLMVGCGRIAGLAAPAQPALTHAAACRHLGFPVAACVDPDAERRQAFARQWEVPVAASSLAELDGHDFDLAVVTAPTADHGAILDQLLELRPGAVFCEKPMTAAPEEGERLVDAYSDRDIPLVVNYTRRWNPTFRRLARDLADGAWGRVASASCWHSHGILHFGSHMLDLMAMLLGPLEPVATLGRHAGWRADDPLVDAVLTAGGRPVLLTGVPGDQLGVFEAQIVTERAIIAIEDFGRRIRIRRTIDDPAVPGRRIPGAGRTTATAYAGSFLAAYRHLQDVVVRRRPPFSNGRSALATERLCHRLVTL